VRARVRADLHWHDATTWAVAGVANAVVGGEADDPGHVRAMHAGVAGRIRRALEYVPAGNGLTGEVGQLAKAGVEHRHHHAGIASGHVPRLCRVRLLPAPRAAGESRRATGEERIIRDRLLRPEPHVAL